MVKKGVFFLLALLSSAFLQSDDYPLRYEGIPSLKNAKDVDVNILQAVLPPDPVILEAGAYQGEQTIKMATLWPEATVYAFEPNPKAFEKLQNRIRADGIPHVQVFPLALSDFNGRSIFYLCHGTGGKDPVFEFASSLLKSTPEMDIHYQGPQIFVDCVNLDSWCKQNHIAQIDLLYLELQGMEFQVLITCPEILKTLKAIYTQTYFFPFRMGIANYFILKYFLESQGFVLLQHIYREGLLGNAIFLRKELLNKGDYVKPL
jgi:FkbM family methyltransferase